MCILVGVVSDELDMVLLIDIVDDMVLGILGM